MSMTEEMLEILIGKYLDGEITPSEQHILEVALDADSNARKLLEQLQDLHERSRQVIASEVLQKGKAAEQIFESACGRQHRTNHALRRKMKTGGWLRFVSGLAAGLIIGLALHFTLLEPSTPQANVPPSDAITQNTDDQPDVQKPAPLPLPSRAHKT
jgi:anti-sigma factor RsiW